MRSKTIIALFITLILVSCSTVSTPVLTPGILATSTLLPVTVTESQPALTLTFLPVETTTISNPVDTERLCTPEDFNSSSEFTGLNNLESLRGFRPERDWVPGEGWEETIGIYDPQFDYSIAGFRNSRQHLYVLERIRCRYAENGKYALSEITDFIWIPALAEDEIIIDNAIFEFCCFLHQHIKDRLQFRFEWFVTSACGPSIPTAILISKYDLASLPPKIIVGDGYNLPVEVIKGWMPNPNSNQFEELSTGNMSCIISFMGG